MFVIFSHLVAFSTLFVAAVSDLKTSDVPDVFGIAGVFGGLALHGAAAYSAGSLEPILWSVGAGLAFSVYGWGAYLLGIWGGADAFAMSVLGFAAPYSVAGPGFLYPVNLFVNIMILGFAYSLTFAVYRAFRAEGVLNATLERLKEQERRMGVEVLAAASLSALMVVYGFPGFTYFASVLALILLYRFFQVLQERSMSKEVPVVDLEPGAVVDLQGLDIGVARQKNLPGRKIERFRDSMGGALPAPVDSWLGALEDKIGYPEVVGIREEEIAELEKAGVEDVEVKEGVRFIPVFPVALAATDIFGGGLLLLLALF